MHMRRWSTLSAAALLVVAACSGGTTPGATTRSAAAPATSAPAAATSAVAPSAAPATSAVPPGTSAPATETAVPATSAPAVETSAPAPATTAAGSGSPTAPGEGIRLGFVTHVIGNPFIQQIVDGAEQAADELGVDLQVTGPEGFDGDLQLQSVQSLADAGVQGIATSIAGESMVSGLNALIDSGLPVVQFNVLSTAVKAPYVGERSVESGRILGGLILEQLGGEGASGKVIIGNCSPGFPVLDNRVKGLQEALAGASGIEVLGPFDVKVAANENFAAWESLFTANPDAVAMVGVCAPDVASLGQLQAANPDVEFVSGGYDLTTENLAAIEAGNAYVSLGQNPFLQGYLPIKMLVDTISGATNVDLTAGGFIDSGTEIATAESVTEPYDLPPLTFEELKGIAASPEASRAYYQPLVDTVIANWPDFIEPVENEAK